MIDHVEVREAVESLLEALGLDCDNPDLKDTPKRVAKMLIKEVQPEGDLESLFNVFPSDHSSMVTLIGHRTYTRCPHHLMPAELDISIGYVPNGRLLGLSKLARIADYMSTGFMLQEEIGDNIAEGLMNALQPKGVAVYIRGRHTCMRARGVKSTHSTTITSRMSGVFLDNVGAREEFLSMVLHGEGR